ncbi:Pr6Pr family membrane protein [Cellulosimicrobium arenosum]|uniref:Pr6Pr family membrane protein n=1 Tax=Cellulosimicrobium arenosum TaxID=2708133 RepID=A0A927PEA5_9MICO|nr:Pr6Pr family membrane protein [Cellulosimicrobium arenosum]MBD8079607.1 Pr6Pr family membrane protein [Cellulosimicrobium arenosum]
MSVLVGLFRLFLVVLALVGTREIWLHGDVEGLVYFTNQTGFLVAISFAWAGIASLLRTTQPPAWFKGVVTLAAAITGLVALLVLEPESPDAPAVFLGLTDGQIEHQVLPLAVFADFVLLDAHRRFRGLTALQWLLYPVAYFVFALVRGALSPGSEYPYAFVDLDALGWAGLGANLLVYGAAFFVLGLVLVGIDRVLPPRPLIGGYPDGSTPSGRDAPTEAGEVAGTTTQGTAVDGSRPAPDQR